MAGFNSSSAVPAATLLDSLDVIAWIADAETLAFSYVNRQGAASLGFPVEQWLNNPSFWSSLLHSADREELLELCARVARERMPLERVHRVADQAGTVRWFRTKVRPLPVADDEPARLLGEMVEVTDLMRDREAARMDQTWLDLILKQAPAIIWTVDRNLRITATGGAALRQAGLTEAIGIGRPLQEMLGTSDPAAPQIAEHLRALQGEAVHYRGSFGSRIYDSYVEPLRSEDQIIGVIGIAVDVTDQAEAEAKRREVEQLYERIVETAEEGIWTIDAEARTTFANQKMATLLGYASPAELVGRSMFDLIDPAARAAAEENQRRRREGIREKHPFQLLRRDGSLLWVEMATSPIYDEQGQFVGALAMVSDISAWRQTEVERERLLGEIDARRELLELIVKHAPTGILLLRGPEFIVEVANPTAHAMAPGRQLEGLRWYDEVMPELKETVQPQIEEVLRSGKPSHVVDAPMLIRRTTGAPAELAYTTSSRVPVRLPDNEQGILLLFNETTAIVKARQEVERLAEISHAQASQLKAILDNMVEAVTVFDTDSRVTFMNRASARMAGLLGRDMVGEDYAQIFKLLDPRDSEGRPFTLENSALRRALTGETVQQEGSLGQLGTGRRYLLRSTAAPLRDLHGQITGAVMVSRDVTEEAEFERLKEQFIAVAAHELKSPVAIMKANAQLVLKVADGLSPPQRQMTQAIERGANRIDKIVQELLDLSQLQLNRLTLTSAPLDLVELVRRVVRRTAEFAPKRELQVEAPATAFIRGDPHRLEWVVTHLVENAIRYSPGGQPVELRVQDNNGTTTLSVRDRGIGIPLDRQRRIFERFYRAHTGTAHDFGGLGVSLYISREIVRRLGGEMWFESAPEQGSTFFVRFLRGEQHAGDQDHPRGG